MRYKNYLLIIFVFLFVSENTFAQSPYELSFQKDAPIILAGVGLTGLGFSLIKKKKELTLAEIAALDKNDINGLDRWAAGNFREQADRDSYIPFYGSFAVAPIVALIDGNQRSKYGQVSLMFLETMSVAGASFTMAAGLVQRSRPLVYNTSLPLDERQDKDAQRSFFAGHTTATAAASFFAAKVYTDFHPESRLKPLIWTAAAAVPAVVAYQRTRAGKHFLTDNILGYAVGMASGILIPQLHKTGGNSLSVNTFMDNGFQGLSLAYTLPK